jgi:hypothetical protein
MSNQNSSQIAMESSAEWQLEESSSYKRNLTDFPVPFTSPILNSTINVNHLEDDVMGVAATSIGSTQWRGG